MPQPKERFQKRSKEKKRKKKRQKIHWKITKRDGGFKNFHWIWSYHFVFVHHPHPRYVCHFTLTHPLLLRINKFGIICAPLHHKQLIQLNHAVTRSFFMKRTSSHKRSRIDELRWAPCCRSLLANLVITMLVVMGTKTWLTVPITTMRKNSWN